MAIMTEEEATRLDELYTKTTPSVNPEKPGIFARQKEMAVILDEFTSRYLASKMLATKRSPSELISDMVHKEIQAIQ
jgi:hypothetical protein